MSKLRQVFVHTVALGWGRSQSETKNKGSNLDVIAIVLINNNQNFQELVIFMRPPLAVFIRHSFLSI